jgi:hypothetical protein
MENIQFYDYSRVQPTIDFKTVVYDRHNAVTPSQASYVYWRYAAPHHESRRHLCDLFGMPSTTVLTTDGQHVSPPVMRNMASSRFELAQ